MGLVHELGGFFNQSGKFKLIFQNIAKSEHGSTFTSLKPLCPTRWTVRTPAIRSVLKQYESVLMALEEMASCSSPETSAKANGLHGTFLKGNTVLGLLMAEDLMGDLECLNTSLQLRKQTVSGMLEAVDHVKTSMQDKRTEEHFDQLLWQQSWTYNQFRSHVRKPTKRCTGQAAAHIHPDAQSLYRIQFYNALDTVNTQFIERFEQAGFHKLQQLENVLLHGDMDKVVEEYPELNSRLLQVQLAMFGANYTYEQAQMLLALFGKWCQSERSLRSGGSFKEHLANLIVSFKSYFPDMEEKPAQLDWVRNPFLLSEANREKLPLCHQEKLLDVSSDRGLKMTFENSTLTHANDKRKKAFGSFA
ncbi:hypothetical protein F7725_000202 [Dissostichus mawsoni]|uniref:Uncharacterized protein n=1 Tax=Dissostichus mawsoni TaxID=36200 RepID=A0A7J5ZH21_DISMA|nr:hypothetical protein F7725_000202 [Dissostichus mawsoni]